MVAAVLSIVHVSGGSCAFCYSCRDFQNPLGLLAGNFLGMADKPHIVAAYATRQHWLPCPALEHGTSATEIFLLAHTGAL